MTSNKQPPLHELPREHTSHHARQIGARAEMVDERASRFDQHEYLWTQMINAEHRQHAIDVGSQTPASSVETIEAREQWSSDWVMSFAEAVKKHKLGSDLVFGKHEIHADDPECAMAILNKYAS
jgi:hypothetical protein